MIPLWVRLALRMFPKEFRDAHGEEVVEFVRRESPRGLGGRLRTLLDLMAAAVRARRAGRPAARRDAIGHDLLMDLRFAARQYRRRPGLALLVVLTLGVGIGAVTAMAGIADAVLLRSLPFPDPDRLVSIYPTNPAWRTRDRLSAIWDRGRFSHPQLMEFIARQRSYEAVGGYSTARATLTVEGGAPEQVGVGHATPGLFDVLGTGARIGRVFTAADAGDVVLLSDAVWRRMFGADPSVVGRTVQLGGRTFTVIGVLPRDFELVGTPPSPHGRVLDAAVWRPILIGPADNEFIAALGRLRPGVTLEQADAEAATLIPAAASVAGGDAQRGGRVISRIADQGEPYRLPLFILVGVTLLLLCGACVSVAVTLLGLGIEREPELTARAALGGSRGRLMRQLLTEGLLLGVCGGVAGVLLAHALVRLLLRLAPPGIAGLARTSLDARILLLAAAVSMLSALLFTIAPALKLSRVQLSPTGGPRVTRGEGRLQHGLIVAEIALATVLLAGAGLLTRTMMRLNAVDPGFEPSGLVTVRIAPDYARFRAAGPAEQLDARLQAYFENIAAALRSTPGVDDAVVAGTLPYSVDGGGNEIEAEGAAIQPGEVVNVNRRSVGARYFEVMAMRRVDGRWFEEADERSDAAPVVIVNETLVRRLWPGQSGVGRRVRFQGRTWTIVGVVADARETDLRGDQPWKVYVPGRVVGGGDVSFILRTTLPLAAIGPAVRERVGSVDDAVPITSITTMQQRIADTLAPQRYRMRLMLAFSSFAGLFAVTGVYGVLSRSAARRRRELGIRAALGAARPELARLLLRQSLLLTMGGVIAGVAVSSLATRVLATMLFETSPNDPVTLSAIVLLMLTLTLLAAALPAKRAAATDPAEIMRI